MGRLPHLGPYNPDVPQAHPGVYLSGDSNSYLSEHGPRMEPCEENSENACEKVLRNQDKSLVTAVS